MAVIKTDFINGASLSYPITSFPDLFAVLNQTTKRKFFEELYRLEGKDGEGMTPEQQIRIFQVGLSTDIPGITYEQAASYVQEYLSQYGDDALIFKLVDAFVDAGLNDREKVKKNREREVKRQALADELEKLQDAKNEAYIKQQWEKVNELNDKISKASDELIEVVTETTENKDVSGPLDQTAQA